MKALPAILIVLVFMSPGAGAATIRVPADQPTIQAGIDAANDGDTVLLSDGTYTGEGNGGIAFHGKAITLRSENGPEDCIIDGEWSMEEPTRFFYLHEAENRSTVIDGLTITGWSSAGIHVSGVSPIIRNCIVTGNAIGIQIIGGYALVESTTITGNSDYGISTRSRARIVDSVITGNNGGISIGHLGRERIENCLIAGNLENDWLGGGGLSCNFESHPLIRNCTIVDNVGIDGGGLTIDGDSSPRLKNCILAGNSGGLGDQFAIFNGAYAYYGSDIYLDHCNVFGETYVGGGCDVIEGEGVIDEDPLFVTGPAGSFYLSQVAAGQPADSPCVDSGDPDSDLVHGTTRIDSVEDSGIVDMGYHYRDPDAGPSPETTILTGPESGRRSTSPVVVYTFTGSDESYPPSSLTYSWRFNDDQWYEFSTVPWSEWSPKTWAAYSPSDSRECTFEVRSRNPEGVVDRISADRIFSLYSYSDYVRRRLSHIAIGPGPGPGNPPVVRTGVDQWVAYSVMKYGVNLAVGNIDGEGPDEVITGPGPGALFGPHVRCFRGDGTIIHNAGFLAYGTNKYGVNVAAGDVDGDGFDEIITGAGPGAVFGPHVRGWNWDGGPAISNIPGISFMAYGTLKWGVNVAAGDLDGDGRDEIVTGAGPGAAFGSHVRGWRYQDGEITAMPGVSYFAYGTHHWGVNVGCGDLDGDGIDELITGPGPGLEFGSHVAAWAYDGAVVSQVPGASFFAYEDLTHGAVVSAADVDGDSRDEILTMPGPAPSNSAWLRGWNVDDGQISIAEVDGEVVHITGFDNWMTHGGNVAGSKNGWE